MAEEEKIPQDKCWQRDTQGHSNSQRRYQVVLNTLPVAEGSV